MQTDQGARGWPVVDYHDLRVYQRSFESAMQVFALSRGFPVDECYSLTDQIRRSSRSVCANLAEAWRKRRYQAAFVSKLSDADAEAAETEVHLDFSFRCGYLEAETHRQPRHEYDHICRQLRLMMEDAAAWCGSSRRVRENLAPYLAGGPARKLGARRSPLAAPREGRGP